MQIFFFENLSPLLLLAKQLSYPYGPYGGKVASLGRWVFNNEGASREKGVKVSYISLDTLKSP